MKRDLLTRKEAAKYLGVHESTLAHWMRDQTKKLPIIKIGRLVRYRMRDIEKFLDSQKK